MTVVREIMTAPVVTLQEDMTLHDATVAMARKKVSGAPVLDAKGRLVGVLSEADILELAVEKVGTDLECPSLSLAALPYERIVRDEAVCRKYRQVGEAKVEKAMNDEIVTVSADDPVEKALETMIRFGVNRLPVVENEKLVGIVTRQDLLWSVCRAMEEQGKKGVCYQFA